MLPLLLIAASPAITCSFLGVTDANATRSWDRNGTSLERVIWPDMFSKSGSVSKPSSDLWLLVGISGPLKESPSVAFKVPTAKGFAMEHFILLQRDNSWLGGVSIPKQGSSADVSYAVSTATWKTVGSYLARTKQRSGAMKPIRLGTQQSKGQPKVVVYSDKLPDSGEKAYRLVAIDIAGKEMLSAGSLSKPDSNQAEFWFTGSIKRLKQVQLQSRPYKWFHVGKVSLQPHP